MKRTALMMVALPLVMVAALSCSASGVAGEEATEPAANLLLPIRNARIPLEGVLSGGQPTAEQIAAAAAAGFKTVINLRTDGEPGFEWERAAVEENGMRYVQIPVAGADGLTRDNVEKLDAVLAEALRQGPVLLHCGSGNRIGAMLALRAAWLQGDDPESALDYGLDSGLTRLEGPTRERLGLAEPAAAAADK